MENIIRRAQMALGAGLSVGDTHTLLVEAGVANDIAHLAVQAANIIALEHMNATLSADDIVVPGTDLVPGPGDMVSVYYSTAAGA